MSGPNKKNILLLSGDIFLTRAKVEGFKNRMFPDGGPLSSNWVVFEELESTTKKGALGAFLNSLEMEVKSPTLDGVKVVVVKHMTGSCVDAFMKILDVVADENKVIFWDTKGETASAKWRSFVSKIEQSGVVVRESPPLHEMMMADQDAWLVAYVRGMQKSISKEAARAMIELAGASRDILASECEKFHCIDSNEITIDMVERYVFPSAVNESTESLIVKNAFNRGNFSELMSVVCSMVEKTGGKYTYNMALQTCLGQMRWQLAASHVQYRGHNLKDVFHRFCAWKDPKTLVEKFKTARNSQPNMWGSARNFEYVPENFAADIVRCVSEVMIKMIPPDVKIASTEWVLNRNVKRYTDVYNAYVDSRLFSKDAATIFCQCMKDVCLS